MALVLNLSSSDIISIDGKMFIRGAIKNGQIKLSFEGPREMKIERLSRLKKRSQGLGLDAAKDGL